jgi:CBS domain containing-hemolysin-like protein
LKLSLPESESYTTIAGFLMTEAGHILKQGETVKYNGLVFHIDRVERRRVISVTLEVLAHETTVTAETPQDTAHAAG